MEQIIIIQFHFSNKNLFTYFLLLHSIAPNVFPFILKKAHISIYTDESTICLAEPTICVLNTNFSQEMKVV